MAIPFQYGRVVAGEDFINRKDEIKRLKSNFESGINTMIISPRRWGKSSLVRTVAASFKKRKDLIVCYIDLFLVRNEDELLRLLARELIKQTSNRWQEWGDAVKNFIQNAVPKVSFGTAEAQAELELNWGTRKPDPQSIYQLAELIAKKKKARIVVCLDEFQNVAHLDDPVAVQKQMRSVWQLQQSVSYCLFGSKKHLLTDIFTNQSMPFYRFGDLMYLDKIAAEHWERHLVSQFEKTGKKISSLLANRLAETVQFHPQYVQQLGQKVWLNTVQEVTEEVLQLGLEELLNDTGIAYHRDVESLTSTQINFLKAYLEGVREFSSRETIRNYHLGGPSNIVRIKKALEQKDIMDFFSKDPTFVDPVFELWFRKHFL